MRCKSVTKSGFKCKRDSCDGDFCRQHNPLNKMDDITCAICLDEIKNPMKLYCRHVFCKECISESVLYTNNRCPCCREVLCTSTMKECIKFKLGVQAANKFALNLEICMFPELWHGNKPWTDSMRRRFFAVYPYE